MSPEQALGKPIDFRSDQFSFGLILHELASGKRAFAKASTVETMAAIVREEPPPMDEKLPAPLRWIIDRCLQKEPQQRYESTRDLFRELRNLRDHFSEAHTSAVLPQGAAPKKRSRWRVSGCLRGVHASRRIARAICSNRPVRTLATIATRRSRQMQGALSGLRTGRQWHIRAR